MTRLLAMAVLTALLVPQDDEMAKKVKQLVEQLRSDDVQTADDAVVELVKLGEAGLPAIKAETLKSTGDTKLKLEAASGEIEKTARRGKAMGRATQVTVKAEATPVSEVLAALATSSGQPLVCKSLPAIKVTLALANAPFWEALDAVCKAAGGVMWRVKGEQILVEAKPYRDLPKVFKGNLVFFLDNFCVTSYLQNGGGCEVALDGAIAWVKGARPLSTSISMEQFEDDKGTKLMSEDGGGMMFVTADFGDGTEEAPGPNRLSDPLRYDDSVAPHEDAEKIAICKGTVTVKYALDWKKALSLDKPVEARGQSHKAGDYTISLQEFSVDGRIVKMRVSVSMRGQVDELPLHARDFVITDKEGKSYPASGSSDDWESFGGNDGERTTVTYALTVKLPEKAEIASLDFMQPTEVEEIVIPFEFKGLGIKE